MVGLRVVALELLGVSWNSLVYRSSPLKAGSRIYHCYFQKGLQKAQNEWAYHVLKNYGNMSSPTVLFVLKEIFDRLEKKNDKENILSFAFGPGLTLESMVFTYQHHG